MAPNRRKVAHGLKYTDDSFFDKHLDSIPDPHRSGKNVLLASFALQSLVVTFGFLSHHYKKTEFGCCGLWAVVVAVLFIAIQWPYYSEWCSKLGSSHSWHRANLFIPFFVFTVVFIMYLGGVLSLMGHSIDIEFFELTFSDLTSVEWLAFLTMSSCYFVLLWLNIVLAYTHRNNLGTHYYAPGEQEVSLVHLLVKPHPNPGSFNYRNLLQLMARVVRLETSLSADRNFVRVLGLASAVQIPFYLFAGLTYGEGNETAFLMVVVCLGILNMLNFWRYFNDSMSRRNRKTRAWQRKHLLTPLFTMFMQTFVYFFTMGTVFFQTDSSLWGDILLDLDAVEIVYVTISTLLIVAVLCTQVLIAHLHLKAWATGTQTVEDGLDYSPPKNHMDKFRVKGRNDNEERKQQHEMEMIQRRSQTKEELIGHDGHGAESYDESSGSEVDVSIA